MTDFPESGGVESWALTVKTLCPITEGRSNMALPVLPARSRTPRTPVRGGFGERFLAAMTLRIDHHVPRGDPGPVPGCG